MTGADGDKPLRRVVRSVTSTSLRAKARAAAESLKAQHAAGRAGDDSPAEPIWPTPKQQLDAIKGLFRSTPSSAEPIDAEPIDERALDSDAAEVAAAMRRVDWAQVREATTERTSDVARTMRSLSEHVEWHKVQPVAAQVSSALIAAVAAGRIPVGGSLGPIVARAIADQNNLGRRVAANLQSGSSQVPPGFRDVVEATATDQRQTR